MRIVIEAQRIFRTNKHGMDFVALESIKELQKIDKTNEYFILVAPGKDKCLKETTNFHIIEFGFSFYPFWEQVSLPLKIKELKPDLVHCTSNTAPLYGDYPLVLTLHDIIFLEPRTEKNKSLYQNLGWYYRKLVVPRIIKKCSKIITVSDFERNRIKNYLSLDESKIRYIYNGYNSHFKIITEDYSQTLRKYTDKKEYIFFLGNTDPKKNLLRTIKAYSIYNSKSNNKLPLLIADYDESNLKALLKSINQEDLIDMIQCVKYIENKDLASIYNGAKIFLYTSLRESFGIPILESLSCGTPVIAGNTSSMPEILGREGIFADPYDENDIAHKILELENNEDLYSSQVLYGQERIKHFSWSNTVKELLQVYDEVIN